MRKKRWIVWSTAFLLLFVLVALWLKNIGSGSDVAESGGGIPNTETEPGWKIRYDYDVAWELFQAPPADSAFLKSHLTPTRDLFPTQILSGEAAAEIDRWLESNRAFLEAYGKLNSLDRMLLVDDPAFPDDRRILADNARAILISKLLAMKVEQDICRNSSAAACRDLRLLARVDDSATHHPFKPGADLTNMVTVNLATAANRAVNTLNFSGEELREILALLEEREEKIVAVYRNLLPEVVADFDRQLDSERRNPVGNDFFWVQIQQGQRRDPAGHPGKKPFLDFFSSRRRRQEVALEKRLMREQIQWLRQLFERRIYDEKAGEILSRIVNSRKEHADSFATSYIDLELLYDRFLGNLTLIRMQAVLAAAVLTMRETGRMPADMSSLSKAGTIPALATFHPLDGKPFQIFQEEIELPDNETGMAIVIQGTGGEAAPRREMRTFCVTK